MYIDVASGLLNKVGYVRILATTSTLRSIRSQGAKIECLMPINTSDFSYETVGSINNAELWVETQKLTVKSAGKSDIVVIGSAVEGEFISKINSRIDAIQLKCDIITAKSYNFSEIYLATSGIINATASMGGSIYYYGDARVEKKLSLGGGITKIERARESVMFEGMMELWSSGLFDNLNEGNKADMVEVFETKPKAEGSPMIEKKSEATKKQKTESGDVFF